MRLDWGLDWAFIGGELGVRALSCRSEYAVWAQIKRIRELGEDRGWQGCVSHMGNVGV